ncbi:MAG TPA: hypothetical protein PKC43_04155 [Phycisphaerales bacterium]|nr:hypothetical protein [Phycisphaerales bacterium]HMP36620.1 hypothetical protein [Phycisphaerales bacterium]
MRAPLRARMTGFSLVELLVVMGVLLLLAILVVVSAGRIGRDVRLATGVNVVTVALGDARSHAIRTNNVVLVTFRVAPTTEDPARGQLVEVVVAEWTRDTIENEQQPGTQLDRFRPVQNLPPRQLPRGIKVAGPWTDRASGPNQNFDFTWLTQPQFAATLAQSEFDRSFAILFGPDGAVVTRNPFGAFAARQVPFVDYDGDGKQNGTLHPTAEDPWWTYSLNFREVNLNPATFLAVYDDADARQRYDTANWAANEAARRNALSEYIGLYADRINFNLFTGVVLR